MMMMLEDVVAIFICACAYLQLLSTFTSGIFPIIFPFFWHTKMLIYARGMIFSATILWLVA